MPSARAQLRNNINIAIAIAESAEHDQFMAQAEADAMRVRGKNVPQEVQARIAASSRAVIDEGKNADKLENEMIKLKSRYNDLQKRYREARNGPVGNAAIH
jgi:IS5 family transposase